MSASPEFLAKFDSLPTGGYGGWAHGKRYRVTKSTFSSGRSQKLEAEELGGSDYISLNLYRLADGTAILKPCEMSEDKVTAFVADLIVD